MQTPNRAGLKLGPQFPRPDLNPRELELRPGTKKKNRFLSSVGAGCHARCRSEEGAGTRVVPAQEWWVTCQLVCSAHSARLQLVSPAHFLRRPPRLLPYFQTFLTVDTSAGTFLPTISSTQWHLARRSALSNFAKQLFCLILDF